MPDIPQEVLDAYWQNMPSPYDQDMEDVEAAKRHIEAVSSAMFLAGKRAGMERAAEIAEAEDKLCDCHAHSESECACGAWWGSKQVSPIAIAQAIRSENDGHG